MNSHLSSDQERILRWVETFGDPEDWAKRAQDAHARAERRAAKLRAAHDALDRAGIPRLDDHGSLLSLELRIAVLASELAEADAEKERIISG